MGGIAVEGLPSSRASVCGGVCVLCAKRVSGTLGSEEQAAEGE